MLVLSRRLNEKITFPNLGITVEVVGMQGKTARLGVTAPPEVRILRHELAVDSGATIPADRTPPKWSHALRNRLNRISLTLQLFEKQWEAGREDEASATLAQVFATLEQLDQDWIDAHGFKQPAAPPPRSRLRTLVVEDDSNERELLASLLTMNGCECQTAADGLDALDYLASHEHPDVVLLDMRMPRCDGPQTLARIRGESRYQGMKIFAISGTRPEELGVPTGPGGIDAWFSKPLNARKLWEKIESLVTTPGRN